MLDSCVLEVKQQASKPWFDPFVLRNSNSNHWLVQTGVSPSVLSYSLWKHLERVQLALYDVAGSYFNEELDLRCSQFAPTAQFYLFQFAALMTSCCNFLCLVRKSKKCFRTRHELDVWSGPRPAVWSGMFLQTGNSDRSNWSLQVWCESSESNSERFFFLSCRNWPLAKTRLKANSWFVEAKTTDATSQDKWVPGFGNVEKSKDVPRC